MGTKMDINVNVPMRLEYVPAALALLMVMGLFSILGTMLFHAIPKDNQDTINIVLGAIGGSVTTIVAFYFGSSKSSATKDATIAEAVKTVQEK